MNNVQYLERGNLQRALIRAEKEVPGTTNFSAALAQIGDPGSFGPVFNLGTANGNFDIPISIAWNVIPGHTQVLLDLELVGIYEGFRSTDSQTSLFDGVRNQGAGNLTVNTASLTWHEGFADASRFNGTPIRVWVSAPNTGIYNGTIRIVRSNAVGQMATRLLTIDPTAILGVAYPL